MATAPDGGWLQDDSLPESIRDAAKATRYVYVKLLAGGQAVFDCLLKKGIQGDGEETEGMISDVVTSLKELEAQVGVDKSKECIVAMWQGGIEKGVHGCKTTRGIDAGWVR